MPLTINDDTAAVIETVLEALDIPSPATLGDEPVTSLACSATATAYRYAACATAARLIPAWLQCLSNRVMHVVIALRVMREDTAEPEWHLEWLRERLAEHASTYRTWPELGRQSGESR